MNNEEQPMTYAAYKAAIIAQGSYCYMGRTQWEAAQREKREGRTVIFEVTSTTAQLAPGWYINDFLPGEHEPITVGPFTERPSI